MTFDGEIPCFLFSFLSRSEGQGDMIQLFPGDGVDNKGFPILDRAIASKPEIIGGCDGIVIEGFWGDGLDVDALTIFFEPRYSQFSAFVIHLKDLGNMIASNLGIPNKSGTDEARSILVFHQLADVSILTVSGQKANDSPCLTCECGLISPFFIKGNQAELGVSRVVKEKKPNDEFHNLIGKGCPDGFPPEHGGDGPTGSRQRAERP